MIELDSPSQAVYYEVGTGCVSSLQGYLYKWRGLCHGALITTLYKMVQLK
jgi:hypothetical protein